MSFIDTVLNGGYRGNVGQMFLDVAGVTTPTTVTSSTNTPTTVTPTTTSYVATKGTPLGYSSAYPVSGHFGSYYTPQNNAWGNMTDVLRQNTRMQSTPERLEGLNKVWDANRKLNLNGSNSDPSFWDNMLEGFGNLAKTNPMAFINTGLGIWNAFADYRNNKKMLGMYEDQLKLQREAYEKNEARNQRRFEMLEQARATSQL